MMGSKQKLDGMGVDALGWWKRMYHWRSGARAWVKTRYARKLRREARKEIHEQLKP